MTSSLLDPLSFRRACARFATGIAIAGVVAPDGTPQGLTVNSFTSVSADPPLVLVCIDHECSLAGHFRRAARFSISVLSEAQRELSVRFSQRAENRFEGVDWTPGAGGVPLLAGCLATFDCKTVRTMDAGDHVVLFGEVNAATAADGRPLLYFDSRYRLLGDA